jgi:hypothetical protein
MTENLQGRTCLTCACMYKVEPPRVPTAAQLAADPDFANRKPILICRLNPPTMVRFEFPPAIPGGPTTIANKLMQAQTDEYFSCWHWKPAGTLPGDVWAVDANSPVGQVMAGKLVL